MEIVYLMLLILAGLSFFFQIEWLMLASIFLFIALIFSKYYSQSHGAPYTPMPIQDESSPTSSQPQPIIVVSGGGGNTATVTDQMIATMMGNVMAMDVFEKNDTPPFFGFLQRGRRMRQGFFDHHGTYGSKHKNMDKQYSTKFLEKLDSIDKKLDKIK